jgi:hypothetical protein
MNTPSPKRMAPGRGTVLACKAWTLHCKPDRNHGNLQTLRAAKTEARRLARKGTSRWQEESYA